MTCDACANLGFDDRKVVEMIRVGKISEETSGCVCCSGDIKYLFQCPECKTVELGYY